MVEPKLILKSIRALRQMDQRTVAKGVGISQQALSEVELGKRQLSESQLKKLAEVLECEETTLR